MSNVVSSDFFDSEDQIRIFREFDENHTLMVNDSKSGDGFWKCIQNYQCSAKSCCPPSSGSANREQDNLNSPSSLDSGNKEQHKLKRPMYVNRNIPATAVAPVYKYEKEYNFHFKERGIAIILNHQDFKSEKLDPRAGTEYDVNRLRETLEGKLQFKVEIHNNLTKSKIFEVLMRVSRMDHSRNDCFLLVCLTHGDQGNQLSSYDEDYRVEELWLPFTNNACPTLAHKPKLFFIQACRGKMRDEGVNMTPFLQNDSFNITDMNAHKSEEYKIPSMSDMVIMYATPQGYVAYLTSEGSPFIKALCNQLNKNAFDYDLMTILEAVIREVSIEYESDHKGNEDMDFKKCTPEIHSTLMRKIQFEPKTGDV